MEPSSSLPIRATPTPYLTPALLLWTRPGRVSNTTHRIPAGSRFIGRIHSSRAGVRVPHYEPELSPVRSRLPVSGRGRCLGPGNQTELLEGRAQFASCSRCSSGRDRKSTRLNSSHTVISYAVFCLKKKKKTESQHAYYVHDC